MYKTLGYFDSNDARIAIEKGDYGSLMLMSKILDQHLNKKRNRLEENLIKKLENMYFLGPRKVEFEENIKLFVERFYHKAPRTLSHIPHATFNNMGTEGVYQQWKKTLPKRLKNILSNFVVH